MAELEDKIEESTEFVNDEEAMAAFEEAAKSSAKEGLEEKQHETERKDKSKETYQKKAEAKPEEKKEDKPKEKEKTPAQELVEQRLKEIEGATDAEEKGQKREEKPKAEPKAEEEGKEITDKKDQEGISSFTKESVKAILDLVSDADLPDKMIIGDDVIDIKEYKAQFPDEFNTMKLLAGIAAQKIAQKIKTPEVDRSKFVPIEKYNEDLVKVQTYIDQRIFDIQVKAKYKDLDKVRNSEEFTNWYMSKPGYRKLAVSLDPEDGLALLDLYAEETGRIKAEEFDKKASAEKEKVDNIHLHTVHSKKKPSIVADDDLDAEKAFIEAARKSRDSRRH